MGLTLYTPFKSKRLRLPGASLGKEFVPFYTNSSWIMGYDGAIGLRFPQRTSRGACTHNDLPMPSMRRQEFASRAFAVDGSGKSFSPASPRALPLLPCAFLREHVEDRQDPPRGRGAARPRRAPCACCVKSGRDTEIAVDATVLTGFPPAYVLVPRANAMFRAVSSAL